MVVIDLTLVLPGVRGTAGLDWMTRTSSPQRASYGMLVRVNRESAVDESGRFQTSVCK